MTRRGFTLVEILVALAVLALGATSVFALIATAGATHRLAVSQSVAAFIADSVFSEVRERLDVTVDAASLEIPDGQGVVQGYIGFTYGLKLEPLDADGNEYLAVCTVKWTKAGAPVSAAFTTVALRRLPASARGLLPSPTDKQR